MSSDDAPVEVDHRDNEVAGLKSPAFFPVSFTKLVVLSICTFGLYEIYWFYRNWYFVKSREESDIKPVVRSIFSYFFCYSLFRRVSDYAAETTGNRPPAGALATGWIVTTFLWRLPDPYWLVSFAAVLFLLPIQSSINSINSKIAPEHDRNGHFSTWNISGVVIGGLVVILVIIGTLLPDEV